MGGGGLTGLASRAGSWGLPPRPSAAPPDDQPLPEAVSESAASDAFRAVVSSPRGGLLRHSPYFEPTLNRANLESTEDK